MKQSPKYQLQNPLLDQFTQEDFPYKDILSFEYLEYKKNSANRFKHPPMANADRAAQFSPFAALTGHEAAIQESQRLTENQRFLSEDRKEELDQNLQLILAKNPHPILQVQYFEADSTKSGGSYPIKKGTLRQLDRYTRLLIFTDDSQISLDQIVDLQAIIPQNIPDKP